jgi:acylpyruvate hydrolase
LKIVCTGLNYREHASEQGKTLPGAPMFFGKSPDAIIGPEDVITWSRLDSAAVDYEGELAVVIGRRARRVSEDDALDFVSGYTIANDVSARDAQALDGQFFRAKSFDTFCPLGPRTIAVGEIDDPQNLRLTTKVNGEVRQDSNTSDMIFTVRQLISYATRFFTLEPGDIMLTGTPSGTGTGFDPPRFLDDGDVVEIEIEGIGTLRNRVTVT